MTYYEHKVRIARRGHKRMYAALVHEHYLVPPAAETQVVDFAVDAAFGYIQQLYAAVKVRARVQVVAAEKFHAVRLVVVELIVGKIFHDVNIR